MEGADALYKGELRDGLMNSGGQSCCKLFDSAFATEDETQKGRCADILRDFCWQKLHTGHWKDVDIQWRDGFTLASLLFVCSSMGVPQPQIDSPREERSDAVWQGELGINQVDAGGRKQEEQHGRKRTLSADHSPDQNQVRQLEEWLRMLDEASMMGGDLFRPALNEVIEDLEDRLENISVLKKPVLMNQTFSTSSMTSSLPRHSLDPGRRVPVEELPSLEDFYVQYMGTKPCLIEGVVDNWPAFRKWTDLEYLKETGGFRTVPIEVGDHYLAPEWQQDLVTLSEFIDSYIYNITTTTASTVEDLYQRKETGNRGKEGKNKIGYLAQHPLFDQIPKLKKDIIVPDYCTLGEGVMQNVNAWFGPSGTVTPLHYDPHHNLLAQVIGRKYVRLYSPSCTNELKPYEEDMRKNSSQIDLDGADTHIDEIEFMDCIMDPGQMLYIPPKWWHYVRSIDISFSVSFWWQ